MELKLTNFETAKKAEATWIDIQNNVKNLRISPSYCFLNKKKHENYVSLHFSASNSKEIEDLERIKDFLKM